MSIDIEFNNKLYPGHNRRFRSTIDFIQSMGVSWNQTTDVRTQIMKSKGARVLGSGNFATVIQYPFMQNKVVRVSSIETVNGERDLYEDYIRYLRRSRANNPCLPTIHAAYSTNGLLFVLLDKYRDLTKPQQERARGVYTGEIKAETPAEKDLRAVNSLFKRSSLQADDVKGDNIMMHGWTYIVVDPLGGTGIQKPEVLEILEFSTARSDHQLGCVVNFRDGPVRFEGLRVSRNNFLALERLGERIGSSRCSSEHYIHSAIGAWLESRGLDHRNTMALIQGGLSFVYSEEAGKVLFMRMHVPMVQSYIGTLPRAL